MNNSRRSLIGWQFDGIEESDDFGLMMFDVEKGETHSRSSLVVVRLHCRLLFLLVSH